METGVGWKGPKAAFHHELSLERIQLGQGVSAIPLPCTGELCIMLVCRKRGRVVEGTSLENWRRVKLFVSSNLTASARATFAVVLDCSKNILK